MEIANILNDLKAIARNAGKAILDIYNDPASFEVETKEDQSPLTIADRASNDLICLGLEQLGIPFPIISEENKQVSYQERKNYPYYWLVDPLDGTKEFIKRNGEFTVNIALIKKNKPVMGIVYAPCLDEMYYAASGFGSFLEKDGEVRRLQAKSFRLADPGLKVVCSRSHLNEATQAFIDRLEAPEKVSKGSSLKFLILAKGEAHAYPRLAPTMEWDTAAAQIVLEEAGGQVVKADSKTPLEYNKEDLLNPHFIAYGNLQ